MKSRRFSMFMMTVTLAYSAPIEYEYETLEVVTLKKIQRQADDRPGKCCTDRSQMCCPYDYDDRCEPTDNRNLRGYKKNKKTTDTNELFFTKFGLPCRINDDRVECGYNGPYITDIPEQLPNPTGNPTGCCNCCNDQTARAETTTEATTVPYTEPVRETTIKSTTSTPETTETSPETTETSPETTETSPETTATSPETIEISPVAKRTTYKKLYHTSTERSPPATKCVTVEENCQIVYEQPCIMDPPCPNDYIV